MNEQRASHTPTHEPRSSRLGASQNASQTRSQRPLFDRSDSELPALPDVSFSHDGLDHSTSNLSDLILSSDDGRSLDEKEIRKHLQDVESSFIPDMGHTSEMSEKKGADDTYLELADPVTASRSRQSVASKASSVSPTTAAAGRAQSRLATQHEVDELGFSKPLIAIPAAATAASDGIENSLSSIGSDVTDRASKRVSALSASSGAQSVASDATIGVGKRAVTGKSVNGSSRALKFLDRLPSLGSVASLDSNDDALFPTLNRTSTAMKSFPITPRPGSSRVDAPTDTVLAARVNSIQVPDTIARDFMSRNPLASLEKRPVSSDGPVVTFSGDRARRTLTLKEQNGKVDKLTKENFDLKLKIHFLDQALRSHSEEGVQELIDKNVQIQTDLANERKEMQAMKRKMRELERKNKEQADLLASMQSKPLDSRSENEEPTLQSEMHEEILHLRQKLDHSENELTTLREEMITEKYEKRKVMEQMRGMANPSVQASNGIRETTEMWQDLLNEETSQREMAEEALRKVKEELANLRIEHASPIAGRFERLRRGSRSAKDEVASDFDSNATLVNQLQFENAELRKEIGAQTSMLTSRNRERERLQNEIEELKLLQRKSDGARSIAGDSIFDRSISRAHNRAPSRASNGTVLTEAQLDDWERKEGHWRDQNAELKLKYQELERTHTQHLQYISALEGDFQEMENELNDATEDLKALAGERDEALMSAEELQAEYEKLEREALAEIEKLEKELHMLQSNRQKTQSKLEQTSDSYRGLQGELREITQSVMNLEDEKQASLRNIETLEQQLQEAEIELQRWESKAKEYAEKNKKLEVAGESLHSEVSFLREEQEGDKIKIGELEDALNAAQQTIADEQEKLRESEDAILEERQQRDVLENQSKEEVQKVLDDLNNENAKTKDEIRKLRRGLSTKEVEANSWRTKLEEFENAFREVLGDGNGTKNSMLEDIDRLQRDLETTANALDRAKMDHADKDRLLRHRDGLLESTSLEARRLSDLLDKERAARKHELDQFEKSSRGQATNLRQIAQYESRILELETGFSQDKRKMSSLEAQYKQHLTDRNSLLLALWNRLSTLCGAEWAQSHALINGEIPSAEVISRSLPAFQRNIIAAIKTIEAVLSTFKTRIRSVEKELQKDYQTLEHNLDMRIRRMDSIEAAVVETQARIAEEADRQAAQDRPQLGRSQSSRSSRSIEEVGRLKSEVKLLKAELKYHRMHPSAMAQQLIHRDVQSSSGHARRLSKDSGSIKPPSPARQMINMLRSNTSSSVDVVVDDRASTSASNRQSIQLSPTPPDAQELRYHNRLKEMERRLKVEREGRLLDRQGARQRLEEGRMENEELKMLLERERVLRDSIAMMDAAGRKSEENYNDGNDE